MGDQKWYKTKTCRLLSMLTLTFSFFLVELIYGYITHSLALISDSYHMLSDVVALGVGIASVRISKLNSQKNTYGWARAEVMGALVNSVFLVALCFTIFIEAIERLTNPEIIEHEDWMLYVGIIGLVINLLGLLLFHQHSHGHGHSHGGSSSADHSHHSHNNAKVKNVAEPCGKNVAVVESVDEEKASLHGVTGDDGLPGASAANNITSQDANESDDSTEQDYEANGTSGGLGKKRKIKSSAQLNMRGVFLHVLGDALGSVIVIISALIIKFVEGDWKYKIDPAMSMVMVCIILSTTAPLLKESALILMQTVPTHIQVSELKKKLIKNIEGVLAVHEFHVWQLAGNRIIATAHIRCLNLRDYMRIAEEVKSFFHNEGIHSTTIQPEFVEFEEISTERDCVLECGPDKTCFIDTCCARSKNALSQVKLDDLTQPLTEGRSLRQRANCCTSTMAVSPQEGCSGSPSDITGCSHKIDDSVNVRT